MKTGDHGMDCVGRITTIEELERLYDQPGETALIKVARKLTTSYRQWIECSRFCVISTVGPEGTDGSPRGDETSVVTILNDETLALPDWQGNNRIDTLRNIVRDERVSLMFMIPGANNVIRVNGTAQITADAHLTHGFERTGKFPKTVIVVSIAEVYSQCARALMRSGLWKEGGQSANLPTAGQMLTEISEGNFDGETYDDQWLERANRTMW